MLPMEVRDPGAYLDLLATLLPYRGIEPWMQGVRLIFRVHREPGGALPAVNVPRTRVEPVDFSPAAIHRSLKAEAEDATRPEAERMQALMTSAWLDGTQRGGRRSRWRSSNTCSGITSRRRTARFRRS